MTKKINPKTKLGFSEGISIICAVFFLALLLKNSSLASNEVRYSLNVCANLLIPSLFPLMVASEIMTESGAIEKITHSLSTPISRLFGVNKIATAPYFLGLLGGYTSSCKSAILLYKNGKISKNDCESIIALSNIPSLAFMTGFIGIGSFNNSTVGWILWFCAVLSTFILGLINKLFFKNDSIVVKSKAINVNTKKKLSKIVINSIAHSAQAMLIICACVVFFSVLISVLSIYFDMLSIPNSVQNLLTGMLEITKGITSCAKIESIHNRALSCAFLVGWSGLCVHFQVIALTEDTDVSLKKYFIYKGLQGIIVFLLTLLIL